MPCCTTIALGLFSLMNIAIADTANTDNYKITWPSDHPTCGNDPSMSTFAAFTTVNTQPDCDAAIDEICRAAAMQTTMKNLGHMNGTCEGHIIFGANNVTYDDCAAGFQSITDTCILMGGPKNDAVINRQFGLRNVKYDGGVAGAATNWVAGNGNEDPGYLMGPQGVFGDDFGAIDADDVLTGRDKVKVLDHS